MRSCDPLNRSADNRIRFRFIPHHLEPVTPDELVDQGITEDIFHICLIGPIGEIADIDFLNTA